jgi:polysaccharide export outer membrane protein
VAFKQEKLFQSEGSVNPTAFEEHLAAAAEAYRIQRFDILAISVFPNKGEQLVDQTGDYLGGGAANQQGNNQQQLLRQQGGGGGGGVLNQKVLPANNMEPLYYNVDEQGNVDLPIVGKLNVTGMKLFELNALLEEKYAGYVVDPYVVSQFANKRVIVMGALGDHVVPLQSDGATLLEVISSLAGGASSLQQQGRASQIRLIRGEPGSRNVLLVDLTTMEGLNQLKTSIQPNDIIYIPPRRRLDRQTLGDISAIFTPIFTSLTLLTTLLSLLRRQ